MDPTQSDVAAVLVPKSSKLKEKVSDDIDSSPATATVANKKSVALRRVGWIKGAAIFDLVMRLGASGAAFGAASMAGQAEQVLPFFTQFFQFHAQYNDLPTLTYFVAANAIVGGYLALSLPFSIICICRPHKRGIRLVFIIFDTIMTAFTVASAGATTAVMYLAHNGSRHANWPAICQNYTLYCQQISSAVIASLVTVLFLISIVAVSVFAFKKISH